MLSTLQMLENKLVEIKRYASSFIFGSHDVPFNQFYNSLDSWCDNLVIDDEIRVDCFQSDYSDGHSIRFMENDEYDIPLLEINFLETHLTKSISVVIGDHEKSFVIEELKQVT